MDRFLKWLGRRLFGKPEPRQPTLRQTGKRISPGAVIRDTQKFAQPSQRPVPAKPAAKPQPTTEFSTRATPSMHDRIEDGGPGKNVLSQPRFLREDSGTHETLKIIDDKLLDAISSDDFDPYNTGRFDRAKAWGKRSRD